MDTKYGEAPLRLLFIASGFDARGSTRRLPVRAVVASVPYTMLSLLLPGLVLLFCLVPGTVQQKDPVQGFCRRFGHQTTVIDSKLYTDGGLINWNPISTYNQNYSSESVRSQCVDV